ncbi:hypothetical protein BDZ94DRAFT_1255877 [Collybia nuda]|uniref:Brain protein I3 n=1 Tax=Collybia nuda TaxID=64659 RepID=A0A9P6CLC9_9AGAR|nr:hypothetical protein BDZ94DRAFT_1255877 [Collybia nuda]
MSDPKSETTPAYPSQPMPQPQQPAYVYTAPISPVQVRDPYRSELYALCAQGRHSPTTTFGLCGILTCIFCFPCGLICLCLDSDRVCSRCGVRL